MKGPCRAALAGLAAAVLVGCGHSGTAHGQGDAAAVRATVARFLAAFGSGEYGAACSLMTADTRSATVGAVARRGRRTGDCASALRAIWSAAPPAERRAIVADEVRSVAIWGTTAEAWMRRTAKPTYLRKVTGRWLVDARR